MTLTYLAVAAFAAFLLIGAPIWAALTVGGTIISLFVLGIPMQSIVSQLFISIDSWLLLAVPYFLFAGSLMTHLGLAGRLFRFIENLLGHLRGGLPATGVVTCAIFGALSGSSTATVVAVGSMLLPHMLAAGYKKQEALGVIAVSGTLGQMIPPSIYLILFASLAQMDVAKLFLSGIAPGIMIAILLAATAVVLSFVGEQKTRVRASMSEVWRTFLAALPALAMPLIVLGGIYAGMFTPTEAAAVAVGYVLIVSLIFERRQFTFRRIAECAESAAVTTAVIFIILGGATIFANALTFVEIPQAFARFMTSLPVGDTTTMAMILLIFLLLGTFLDPVPILYITMPIVLPVVQALGVSLTHFAILSVTCMMIAQVTPPIGMSLFALGGFFNTPITAVARGSLPYLGALLLALLVLWQIPEISLLAPQ